jgi:hypothetical protein
MAEKIDHTILDGENISWIENDKIKLGINLGLGGAVTYLAEHGKPNLINSADWGRQVQMSFYSYPVPFHPEGYNMQESWKFIGWNPIQSGDCYGSRSQILAHENNGDTIYVKCIPMHWPLDNYPGECTFETWYRLDGVRVIINARINNNRPDKTPYPARSQELPAVYTNGEWYKLVSYIGCNPFTDDNTEVLVDLDDGKGWPWIGYRPTENWAALVDKDNYGLGVYNPQTNNFIGGFAGKKGAGGPKDGPTGYISPLLSEVLDYNIVFEYNYELIVGTLDEIRRNVYRVSKKKAESFFEFRGTRSNWSYRNITDEGFPVHGFLSFSFEEGGALISPDLYWGADDIKAVEIDAEFTSCGDIPAKAVLSLYDGRDHERGYVFPEMTLPFMIKGDGIRRVYRVPADGVGKYGVTGITLNFGAKGSAKIYSVEIKN